MLRRSKGNRQKRTNQTALKAFRKPSTKKLPRRSDAARERSIKALWSMRQGDSLAKAARDNGVAIRTIKRYVGSALVQDRPGGRIRATKSDRLVRYLQIAGHDGIPVNITARGSKVASEVAKSKPMLTGCFAVTPMP